MKSPKFIISTDGKHLIQLENDQSQVHSLEDNGVTMNWRNGQLIVENTNTTWERSLAAPDSYAVGSRTLGVGVNPRTQALIIGAVDIEISFAARGAVPGAASRSTDAQDTAFANGDDLKEYDLRNGTLKIRKNGNNIEVLSLENVASLPS